MKNWTILILFSIAMLLTSCEKDPKKVITTVIYTLDSEDEIGDEVPPVTLTYRDLDGDAGGNPPEITGGTLRFNTVYRGSLRLLNESDPDNVEDITLKIQEEGEKYQFFFSSTGSMGVSYDDKDGNGNPIGLSSLTGGRSGGDLTVTLIHKPVKDAEGVSGGDITNAGGETDISVTFPIKFQ